MIALSEVQRQAYTLRHVPVARFIADELRSDVELWNNAYDDAPRWGNGEDVCPMFTMFMFYERLIETHGASTLSGAWDSMPVKATEFWTGPMRPRSERRRVPAGPCVYGLFIEGEAEPRYVGQSVSLSQRLDYHARKFSDITGWEAFYFKTIDEMTVVESDLIALFKPERNRQLVPSRWQAEPIGIDEAIAITGSSEEREMRMEVAR